MFTDDVPVIIKAQDTDEFMSTSTKVISKLNHCFSDNYLINTHKTQFLQFKLNNRNQNYDLNLPNLSLQSASCSMFLGVTFDHSVKWHLHI